MKYQQIISFLEKSYPNLEIYEGADHFRLPTICHNLDYSDASQKLYLYKNEDEDNPLFHCYTECSETFNVYQLIQKRGQLENKEINFREAYKIFHGHDFKPKEVETKQETHYIEQEFKNPLSVRLQVYPQHVLDLFKIDYLHPWALEGIDLPTLRKFNIGYSNSYQGVMIPHMDWRGNMIGLRIRTYDPNKVDRYKYMPAQFGNLYYRHPTSLNFFGVFQNQNNVKQTKEVYLFEGEKSVLQFEHMLEADQPNNSLAICGKNISKWHQLMLIYFLGVERVFIGFDKEYDDFESTHDYIKRIEAQTRLLQQFAEVYVLIDDKDLLNQSQSPVDRDIRTFYNLKHWRIN